MHFYWLESFFFFLIFQFYFWISLLTGFDLSFLSIVDWLGFFWGIFDWWFWLGFLWRVLNVSWLREIMNHSGSATLYKTFRILPIYLNQCLLNFLSRDSLNQNQKICDTPSLLQGLESSFKIIVKKIIIFYRLNALTVFLLKENFDSLKRNILEV
jgi:hypothetical protein